MNEFVTLTEGGFPEELSRRILETMLHPMELGAIIPAYDRFGNLSTGDPLLWAKATPELEPSPQVVVALLGPSAAGKDTIIELVGQEMGEKINAPLTATTRQKRSPQQANDPADVFLVTPGNIETIIRSKLELSEGSKNLSDRQIFLTQEAFKVALEKGLFIEHINQGGNFYGTLVSSMEQALNSGSPVVIWRGELEGSQRMRRWMEEKHPETPFIIGFILPEVPFFELAERIVRQRGLLQSMQWRIAKAMREIFYAPELADILILNPLESDQMPHQAAMAIAAFLNKLIEKDGLYSKALSK